MKSLLVSLLAAVILAACAAQPGVIGKWRSSGDEGTLEFKKDGTFLATDNMGATAKGTYQFLSDGKLRMELTETDILNDGFQPVTPPEVLDVTVSVTKTQLRLSHPADDEPEIYRKSD